MPICSKSCFTVYLREFAVAIYVTVFKGTHSDPPGIQWTQILQRRLKPTETISELPCNSVVRVGLGMSSGDVLVCPWLD
jgi:hypothetical protein